MATAGGTRAEDPILLSAASLCVPGVHVIGVAKQDLGLVPCIAATSLVHPDTALTIVPYAIAKLHVLVCLMRTSYLSDSLFESC